VVRRLFSIVAVVVPLLYLGACGDSQSSKIAEGKPAPDFTLPNLNGAPVSLSDLRGKAVVVRFWSDWCAFCKEEMTDIEPIYNELKDGGLVILAVNVGQDRQTAYDFVTGLGITYPTLLDEDSKVAAAYGVIGLPTTFFVNADGVVAGKVLGEAKEGVFIKMVRKAMS